MTKAASSGDAPFDLDKLKQIVEMMEKHGLSEINLRRGEEQWRLRRGGAGEVVHAIPAPMHFAPSVPAPVMQSAPAATAATAPAPAADAGGLVIKSPTVGTFYTSPSPEEPAFVSVGSVVTPETVVCLVEAMKVFNQIPAEISGTITAILVKSGEPVEFGQPLFRVKP